MTIKIDPPSRSVALPYDTYRDRPYVPTDRARAFHAAPERYKLFGGAVGGGKTAALACEALLLSWETPHNEGIVGRRDFDDLRRTTYAEVLKWCPPKLIRQHHKSEHWLELINGSLIHFMELKDAGGLKNLNLGWFAIDQAEEVPYESYTWLQSRLRRGDTPRYGLLSANPEPGWVKDRFVTQHNPGEVFIRSLPEDNPYLPDDYVSDLLGRWPETYVRKLLLGNWDVVENAIYPQLDRGRHLVPMPTTIAWEDGAIGVDFGRVHNSAVVALQRATDGRYWVRECWAKPGGDVKEIGVAASEQKGNYSILKGRVDPIQEVLGQELMFSVASGSAGSRLQRISNVTRLLNDGALFFDVNGPGTHALFNEMLGYHWEQSETTTVRQFVPVRKDDDRVAALEYAVEELAGIVVTDYSMLDGLRREELTSHKERTMAGFGGVR